MGRNFSSRSRLGLEKSFKESLGLVSGLGKSFYQSLGLDLSLGKSFYKSLGLVSVSQFCFLNLESFPPWILLSYTRSSKLSLTRSELFQYFYTTLVLNEIHVRSCPAPPEAEKTGLEVFGVQFFNVPPRWIHRFNRIPRFLGVKETFMFEYKNVTTTQRRYD